MTCQFGKSIPPYYCIDRYQVCPFKECNRMTLLVKKYGQVTQVYLDDKMIYTSANTVKAEAKKLRVLMEAMTLTTVNVTEG